MSVVAGMWNEFRSRIDQRLELEILAFDRLSERNFFFSGTTESGELSQDDGWTLVRLVVVWKGQWVQYESRQGPMVSALAHMFMPMQGDEAILIFHNACLGMGKEAFKVVWAKAFVVLLTPLTT